MQGTVAQAWEENNSFLIWGLSGSLWWGLFLNGNLISLLGFPAGIGCPHAVFYL